MEFGSFFPQITGIETNKVRLPQDYFVGINFINKIDKQIQSDKRKIEAAEMRFLRPMAGCTLWDKRK